MFFQIFSCLACNAQSYINVREKYDIIAQVYIKGVNP